MSGIPHSRRWRRLVLAGLATAIATTGCATLVEVSDRAGENQGDFGFVTYDGGGPTVSRDGRYAVFLGATDASDPPTANGSRSQVYRRDNLTGDVVRVSSFADGSPASALGASISGDGRYVAFVTWDALVPEDTNAPSGEPGLWGSDVYVRDMATGTTTRESLMPNGAQFGSGLQFGIIDRNVFISDDGRFIAFANRFDSHDAVLYLRRRITHTTKLVYRGNARLAGMSGDGFHLAAAPDNGCIQVPLCQPNVPAFLIDWKAGTTFPLGSCSPSTYIGLSYDGRYAAVSQYDHSDVTCDGGVWRFDRNGGPPVDVSHDTAGVPREGHEPSINADGSRVTFVSQDALVPEDGNGVADVYVSDLATGVVGLASADALGVASDGANRLPWISGDGQYVVFTSDATNLTPNGGGREDHPDVIFVSGARPRITAVVPDHAGRGSTVDVTIVGTGFAPNVLVTVEGTGVSVTKVDVATPTTAVVTLAVAGTAPAGVRTLRVVNPGTYGPAAGWCFSCFTVT